MRVPAKLTVDGKVYEGVGVNFRGSSSYIMSGPGLKRSLNLRIDHTVPDQRLRGRKRLNLLNSQGDPTFVRTILYNQIELYVPAPKSCDARVVINGESWGIYIFQEEFDGDFLEDRLGRGRACDGRSRATAADGTFAYRGEEPEAYRITFELKTRAGEAGVAGPHRAVQDPGPDPLEATRGGPRASPRHSLERSGSWRSTTRS